MGSDDKPILTLKIPVTILFRFRYFADFDIKIVILGENSFEFRKYYKPIWKLCNLLSLSLSLDYFSFIQSDFF